MSILETLIRRLGSTIGLDDDFTVPESGRFTLFVDNELELEFSARDQQQVLVQSVIKKLDGDERGSESVLRELLQRSTAFLRESRSVLTIDPTTRCAVLFSTANVETLQGPQAELWLEGFLNDLGTLRKIASPAPAWEMPVRFLRP